MLKQTLTQRSLALGKPAGSGVTYQLHRTTLNAAALREAGNTLWAKIRHLEPTYLLAPGLGAAPIAAAIGQAALKDKVVLETLAVRDPAKSRQGERLVEGYPPPAGQAVRAIFVDDTITHGTTYRQTLTSVAQAGIAVQIVGCALLLDAWHPYGSRQIAAAGVPVYSALRRHDVGLTRDALGTPMPAPFDLSKSVWIRHGLVTKPEFTRKAIPVIHDGSVIVACDDCSIRSFDLATGDERWVYESPRPRSKGCGNDLTVQPDGYMVVGLYDGMVTKLNVKTGEVAWSRLIAMAIHSAPTVAALNDGFSVFVSTEDRDAQGKAFGRVVSLDYDTGALQWQVTLRHLGPTQTAYHLGQVAVAANDGVATLIDADAGGVVLWQAKLPALARGRPVFDMGKAIYACENGEVLALSCKDGSTLWRTRPSTGFDHAAPLQYSFYEREIILLDNTMHILALNTCTGALLWVQRLRGKHSWRPTVLSSDSLLTWSHDGHVAVIDLTDPCKTWETKAKGSRVFAGNTPAAVGNGHVVRLCSDGRLAVFKLNKEYL